MPVIQRRFTEIRDSGSQAATRVKGLADVRELRAYVLLGGPGAGKTTAFRQEARQTDACFVTARDFICLERAQWGSGTVFIDGLDEMRVGSSDPRMPMDQIRSKLSQLGCPRFRISCRAGEWLGSNDRDSLKALTDGDEVRVFRLEPLGEEEIRKLLNGQHDAEESERILQGAKQRGLLSLLGNPLSLELLAGALSGADWPQTRTELFELACEKFLFERNREHVDATAGRINARAVLGTAGQLCAFQLLTGKRGYVRTGVSTARDFIALSQLGPMDDSVLNQAIGSRLFESPDAPGQFVPIHRQVAEFVAGRYLAALIRDGLSVGRVLSLACGYDGRVVSEFSGVTAWLAAQCKKSRSQIIDCDPLGTLLHGDVKGFSPQEKSALVQRVAQQLLGKDDYHRLISSRDANVEDLATPDMAGVFRRYLATPVTNDCDLRATLLVLRSLQFEAVVSGLTSDLLRIVRDDQWHTEIRSHALRAFLRQCTDKGQAAQDLTGLLEDLANGDVHDEYDELLGLLLDKLYPSLLGPSALVRFLKPQEHINLSGRYKLFWYELRTRDTDSRRIAELLDSLCERLAQVRERFTSRDPRLDFVYRLPGSLVARYLSTATEEVNPLRLYNWVAVSFVRTFGIDVEDKNIIKNWIADHPGALRSIVDCGLKRCAEAGGSDDHAREFRTILDSLDSPRQLVEWLHEQSLSASDPGIGESLLQLSERGIEIGDAFDGPSAKRVEAEDANDSLPTDSVREMELERPIGSKLLVAATDEEHHVEPWQEEWRVTVRRNQEALRANRCPPSILNGLANAYFGQMILLDGKTPTERLRSLLGDQSLVDAALGGLRGTVHRDDIPSSREIVNLVKDDLIHPLAYPFLAGLAEIDHAQGKVESLLDQQQLGIALAIHYAARVSDPEPYRTEARGGSAQGSPPWHRSLLQFEPGLVAEVLVKVARAEISKGFVLFHVLHQLEVSPDHAGVARLACLPLLRSIPPRSNVTQMDGLACLLRAAIQYCDPDELVALIDQKLSLSTMHAGQRVYWLTAGLFVTPTKYRKELVKALADKEMLISRLIDLAVGSAWDPPLEMLDTLSLECLIRAVGKLHIPLGRHPLRIAGSLFGEELVKLLSKDPSTEASAALARLSQSTDLQAWRHRMREGQVQQAEIRRAASFRYVSTRDLRRTLRNQQPASAADLAALTADLLEGIARTIRDGNTSGWRQYWDFDKGKHPLKPRHEELCRDSLLSTLQRELLPLETDALPEGHYAGDRRADIRVSYGEFNLPVEIKKSLHRQLWSSIRNQLVRHYTRDPGCDGYAIYVVLWFGADTAQPSPEGSRPRSANDLKNSLEDKLTASERLKISIVVIDVENRVHSQAAAVRSVP